MLNIRNGNPLLSILNNTLIDLPTPANINVHWNYGSLLGTTLVIQLITGILLATRYTTGNPFSSLIHLTQDTSHGWLLRLLHSTGATFFFLFLYLHISRGIYYGLYNNNHTWTIGVTLYLLSIATAFLGYVLPWGQISFWAATVITNLLSAIPYIGNSVTLVVWGGFSVGTPTLTRFFALHYLLPFIITFLSILHLFFLHQNGSNNPLGVSSATYKLPFHHYFVVNDLLGIIIFFSVLLISSLTVGPILLDPENFIPANPIVTPTHIQPEWYFLFAYAILRSIPSNLGGVIALLASVLFLYLFPLNSPNTQGVNSNPLVNITFWFFVVTFLLLTYLGAIPATPPYTSVSLFITILYFFFATILLLF